MVGSISVMFIYVIGVVIWKPFGVLLKWLNHRRKKTAGMLRSIEVFERDDESYPPLLDSK